MKKVEFKNKYGKLVLEPVGPYQKVSEIRVKDQPEACCFNIDVAEKVALITENKGIQICFQYPELNRAIVIHHLSPSIAAVCKILEMEFADGVDATEELKPKSNPYGGFY